MNILSMYIYISLSPLQSHAPSPGAADGPHPGQASLRVARPLITAWAAPGPTTAARPYGPAPPCQAPLRAAQSYSNDSQCIPISVYLYIYNMCCMRTHI